MKPAITSSTTPRATASYACACVAPRPSTQSKANSRVSKYGFLRKTDERASSSSTHSSYAEAPGRLWMVESRSSAILGLTRTTTWILVESARLDLVWLLRFRKDIECYGLQVGGAQFFGAAS